MNPLSTQANVPIISSARPLTSGHAPVMGGEDV